MIETYKLITRKEKIDFNQFFKLATNDHYLRGHSKKIEKTRSILDSTYERTSSANELSPIGTNSHNT